MSSKREHFANRKTAIMAMAGSAIGLGNIWRFPYIVGEYGGAAFIIVYIACMVFLSLPILVSESVIGRHTQKNTVGAMEQLAPGSAWKWLGLLTVISPIIVLSYYSVVGGWSIEYIFRSLTFSFVPERVEEVSGMFGDFVSSPVRPLVCHFLFLALSAGIVLAGVRSGIEKFNKITIPALFILIIVIMVYSVSLPGAGAGVKYLVKPDFSKLSTDAFSYALGQSFFSLSLGVGTMLTYASYISREENLMASCCGTAFFDLLFAVIAGFAVMPAVFAAGLEPSSGPGLVFEVIPYIFAKMGAGGRIICGIAAIVFFVTILAAALSSEISMMEVGVAYLMEEKGVSRRRAVLGIFFFALVTGGLCSLSFGPLSSVKIFGSGIFDFFDKFCSNILLTLGALLFCIFAGWKMKRSAVRDELTNGGSLSFNGKIFPVIYFLIRYAAPVAVMAIFLSGIIG